MAASGDLSRGDEMKLGCFTSAACGLVFAATPALAHHAMDGMLPRTAAQGFLSGLGHPVIGLDHLAFLLLAGLLAEGQGRLAALVPAFVFASIGGAALHLFSPGLPGSEILVALSLIVAGVCLVRPMHWAVPTLVSGFVLAGLAHGYAFGESILGAEPTPIATYLAGLGVVQTLLAFGAGLLLRQSASVRGLSRPAGLLGTAAGVFAFGLALIG